MRIVVPVHHFPPRYSAGAELYTYRLAKWLQSHGHAVEVVAVEDIESGSASALAAVQDVYDDIPVWRLSFNLLKAPQRRLWEFDNPLLGEWFEEYFQRHRPDIAHFQAGYLLGVAPIFAAHRVGVPIVLTLHDYWFLCPQHTLQRSDGGLCATVPNDPAVCARCRLWGDAPYARVAQRLGPGVRSLLERFTPGVDGALIARRRERLQAALALAARVLSPSRFLRQHFEPLVSSDRLLYHPVGLDVASLRAAGERRPAAHVRFGYVGQVARHKGVHVVVEAFTRLATTQREAELHIWGGLATQPAYVAQLRALAGDDPRIQFHDRFAHRELPAILQNLDFLVAPSIWYENSPLAIMEAYAADLPVICSDHGGMVEMVNAGEDGMRFRPGDVADLAGVMQRILDDVALAQRLQAGARARTVIDVEEEMRRLSAIYAEVRAEALATVNYV